MALNMKNSENIVKSRGKDKSNVKKTNTDVIKGKSKDVYQSKESSFEKSITPDKKNNNGILSEKVFIPRNSLLTDLMHVEHISTIYNLFIVIILVLLLQTIVTDLCTSGSINLGTRLVWIAFKQIHWVSFMWILMFTYSLSLYGGYSLWKNTRKKMKQNSSKLYIWDRIWVVAFISYMIIFTFVPPKIALCFELPFASSFIVLMEQTRFLMKTYAFVRSNVGLCIETSSKKDQSKQTESPGFDKYLYFLFIPTLVYRNSYPRTKEINWIKIMWHLCEFTAGIFFKSFVWEKFFVSRFEHFGIEPMTTNNIIISIFGSMIPAILVYTCGFYILLHSWMNIWAEMLTFADRVFYLDWWNSSSYSRFYRTWNIVVHDWLFTYIYKDVYEKVTNRNRTIATLSVFYISALFHEYILAITLRFCFPVLLILFGVFGTWFTFIMKTKNRTIGNIILWFTLITGNGVLFSLYTIEFYARHNCPRIDNTMWDYFIPRAWNCNAIL